MRPQLMNIFLLQDESIPSCSTKVLRADSLSRYSLWLWQSPTRLLWVLAAIVCSPLPTRDITPSLLFVSPSTLVALGRMGDLPCALDSRLLPRQQLLRIWDSYVTSYNSPLPTAPAPPQPHHLPHWLAPLQLHHPPLAHLNPNCLPAYELNR